MNTIYSKLFVQPASSHLALPTSASQFTPHMHPAFTLITFPLSIIATLSTCASITKSSIAFWSMAC